MPADRIVHIVASSAAFCGHLERLLHSCGIARIVHETNGDGMYPAEEMTAGCILLDIETPGTAWLSILSRLKGHGVHLPVVITAPAGNVAMAVQAMKAGVVDFLERPFDDHHLVAAIEAALEDPSGAAIHHAVAAAAHQLAVLSRRERQVLDAIVAGHLNKIIAHNLAISMRTVEVHRAHILDRLGIRSIAEAIRLSVLANLAPAEHGDDERS